MRSFGRFLGRVLLVLAIALAALWMFGPREEVDLNATFEPRKFGEGVQVYFEAVESRFDDITPGVQKRVLWQPGFKERRTPYSILYVHGFSATSEEIRPVPDTIADALKANLIYTRLAGHGRNGDALGDIVVNDWMQDMAEGMAAARAVGEKVIVIATSTGGTLAAAAMQDPAMSQGVAAVALVSPNFGINDPLAWVLSLPGARFVVPLVEGETRSFEPANEAQGTYWTKSYPTVAVLPLAALVDAVVSMDFSDMRVPALFRLSDDDLVVRPDLAREVAGRWGSGATVQAVTMGAGDDPSSHVIAGDIMSPGQTRPTVDAILEWLAEQGIE